MTHSAYVYTVASDDYYNREFNNKAAVNNCLVVKPWQPCTELWRIT